jgi:hypothetical protein
MKNGVRKFSSIASPLVRLWLTVGLLSLLVVAGILSRPLEFRQQGVFESTPPSPYFHYLPRGTERGTVLVIHGLDASKQTMTLLCLGLSDAGFNVYSMDLPGHGDSKAGFNGVLAIRAVDSVLHQLGPETMVIGHSLGGTLLLDIANDRTFSKMVLLSPAPTAIERIHSDHVLVLTGQFDLPPILQFVPQLASPEVELRTIPGASHSGYLFRPGPIREIVSWLGGDPTALRTANRLLWLFIKIICAVLLPCLWLRGNPIPSEFVHIPARLLTYIASSLAALWISSIVVFEGLHLFSTDYLVSFVLLVGMIQFPAYFRKIDIRFSKIIVSLLAAACVIAVVGYVGAPLGHLTLSSGRWWRFIAIAFSLLPLSLADEVLLRPIRPWWKAAGASALTRVLIAAFVLTGVLTTNRSDAFVGLIIHFIVLFWIALWFVGELVRRNIQNPAATGIFMAVVQAWVFAAVFVLV